MASLRELQLGFMTAIFATEPTGFGPEIVGGGSVGEERLATYRNNVFGGLTQALRLTYPTVHILVGEGFFGHMAKGYIREHPSPSGDLTHFGNGFPDFLERFSSAAGVPYLPDMAHMEWLCHLAYHAADHALLSLERLAVVPPERYDLLQFKLHPACHLIKSNYPLHRIWEICQPGHPGDETVALSLDGATLLLKRTGRRVVPQPLTPGEFAMLEAFATGQQLAEACAAALRAEPGFDLSGSLQRFVAWGVVVDFCG